MNRAEKRAHNRGKGEIVIQLTAQQIKRCEQLLETERGQRLFEKCVAARMQYSEPNLSMETEEDQKDILLLWASILSTEAYIIKNYPSKKKIEEYLK